MGDKAQDAVPPPEPCEQDDEEGNCDNRDDRVDAAKLGGGEDDERNENGDEENPRIVAWMDALDEFGHDRNVAPLRVADQRHRKTCNPSWPPVENIGMADDLDLGSCPRDPGAKGFPEGSVLWDCVLHCQAPQLR